VQFDDVYRTTALEDGFLIKRLNKSIILPTANKEANEEDDDSFDGATVLEPQAGLYKNVLCVDVAGMYPSIIKTFNISYETIGGNDIILPTGHKFSNKPGIIPMFLDELAVERKEFKLKKSKATNKTEKALWDQRQYATKVIMNSLYGYLGYVGSRLYKKDVAESITLMGQYYIKHITKWISENGNRVIYGDTDSNYFLSTKDSPIEIVREGMEVKKLINKNLDELSKSISGINYVAIDFEKAIEKILFTDAKKRYAYISIWSSDDKFKVDRKIKIVGFDSKRSDSSPISKFVQLRIIEMIMEEKEKKEIFKYLREIEGNMRKMKYNDVEIGFPKGISQNLDEYDPPTPIIKGAIYSNKYFKTNFGKGSKPKFIYIKTINGKEETVSIKNKTYKLESLSYDTKIPEGVQVDWKKMCKLTIESKVKNLLESVGIAWEDLSTQSLFNLEDS